MNVIHRHTISWPTWSHWRLLANSSASRQLAPPQACGKGGGPRLGILKLQGENVGGTSPNFWHSKFYTPEKPRWNLKITQSNRKSIFQTSFSVFMFIFQGGFFQCTTHSCFEKHRLGFPFSWMWKGNQETQKLKQLETSRGCCSNIKWPTTSKHIVDLKISELTKSPPPKKKRCYQDCTTHGFAALPPK